MFISSRLARLALAAALFGCVSPAAPSAPAQTCLHIEARDAGTPVVRASLNGRGPFVFVLDTGSSGTSVNPETLAQVGAARDTASEQAQGMGGALDVQLYRLHSMQAGPLALHDFVAPALPAPDLGGHEVVGLAGVDLFGQSLAVWDPRAGCVGILNSGAQPAGDWHSLHAQWLRPWKVMLPIEINGVGGWAMLDTGAQYTTLSPAFAERLGLTQTAGHLRPSGSITGIDGRELPLSEADVSNVTIGVWHWNARTVRVGALPVFARLGDAGNVLAIVGMDWLANEGFAIDYGASAVWLKSQDHHDH